MTCNCDWLTISNSRCIINTTWTITGKDFQSKFGNRFSSRGRGEIERERERREPQRNAKQREGENDNSNINNTTTTTMYVVKPTVSPRGTNAPGLSLFWGRLVFDAFPRHFSFAMLSTYDTPILPKYIFLVHVCLSPHLISYSFMLPRFTNHHNKRCSPCMEKAKSQSQKKKKKKLTGLWLVCTSYVIVPPAQPVRL